MALTDQVLQSDSLTVSDGQLWLSVGSPWFRALPWGALANLTVNIDGREYPPDELAVQLHPGSWTRLSDLAASPIEWFMQDRQLLRVGNGQDLAPGEHQVTAKFNLVMPNLFAAPGQPITFPSVVSKTLTTH